MNWPPMNLNGEDLMLLLLLLWLSGERKTENTEMLIGLGFLLYVGLRERNEKGRLERPRDEELCL